MSALKRYKKRYCAVLFVATLAFAGFSANVFGVSRSYIYDSFNRLIKIDYGNGTITNYSYDSNGNRLTKTSIDNRLLINVTVSPVASGVVSGSGAYLLGDTASLFASPTNFYHFLNWTEGNTILGDSSSLQIPVSNSRNITANFVLIPKPQIVAYPQVTTFVSGNIANLSIGATGDGNITYQWYRNGVAISGATSASLSFPTVHWNNAGQYQVAITNIAGTTKSNPITLGVQMLSYSQWKDSLFNSQEIAANDPAVVGPLAKLNGADMPNLMRYAFGIAPRDPITGTPFGMTYDTQVNPAQNVFYFHRLIGSGGLTYRVEVSDDLNSWDTTQSQASPYGQASPNPDGLTEKVFYKLNSPTGVTKKYWRVSIIQPNAASTANTFSSPTITNTNIFADSFTAPTIDSNKWTPQGTSITQSNGLIQVRAEITDQNSTLNSKPAIFDRAKPIILERAVWLRTPNDKSLSSIQWRIGSLPPINIFYGKFNYPDYPYRSVQGVVISRSEQMASRVGTEADCSTSTPIPWEQWFVEKVIYDPASGNLQYFINGTQKITFNVGVLPTTSHQYMSFSMVSSGLQTGHEQTTDWLQITQDNAILIPPVAPNATFTDHFDDGQIGQTWRTFSSALVEEKLGHIRLAVQEPNSPRLDSPASLTFNVSKPVRVVRRLFATNRSEDAEFYTGMGFGSALGLIFMDDYTPAPSNLFRPVHGIVISKSGSGNPYLNTSDPYLSGIIPAIWGRWMREKVEYFPASGILDYYIDDEKRISLNIGSQPTTTGSAPFHFLFEVGIHNGNELLMDYVRYTQNDPGEFLLQPSPADGKGFWFSNLSAQQTGVANSGGAQKDDFLQVAKISSNEETKSLLQFDTQGMPSVAKRVFLYLYMTPTSLTPSAFAVDKVTSNWSWIPAKFLWSDFPTTTPFTEISATPTAGTWVEIEVTALYNGWQNGSIPNYGVALRTLSTTANTGNSFYSSRYTGDPTKRPKLVVIP